MPNIVWKSFLMSSGEFDQSSLSSRFIKARNRSSHASLISDFILNSLQLSDLEVRVSMSNFPPPLALGPLGDWRGIANF